MVNITGHLGTLWKYVFVCNYALQTTLHLCSLQYEREDKLSFAEVSDSLMIKALSIHTNPGKSKNADFM